MGSSREWMKMSDRTYGYEDDRVSATLRLSSRTVDAEDSPQLYRYRQHRVRIIDKVTGQEDIYSHPAKDISVDDEIAWADDILDRHLTDVA